MSNPSQTTQNITQIPRRAVDIAKGCMPESVQPLFDAFWRSGELALAFGEPGVGNSVLAAHIADALARGRAIEGFDMPSGPKGRLKVLYVDLVLSDAQFALRYGSYKFSANLYRDAPLEGEDLAAWVRAMVSECGFKAVVIDDLSMVSRTDDGTRETLALIRELRRLTIETGVSILVLADSFPFANGREIGERDLRRSRVLCGVADSVFAIGSRDASDKRRVVQTRSRSGELKYTPSNPLFCFIDKLDDGLLGMDFEEPEIDEDLLERIRKVKRLHDVDNMSFREIAIELETSKSTAQRLYAEWRPELADPAEDRTTSDGNPPAYYDEDLERWISHEEHTAELKQKMDEARARNRAMSAENREADTVLNTEPDDPDGEEAEYLRDVGLLGDTPTLKTPRRTDDAGSAPSARPFAAGLARRQITDLEESIDSYGNQIFIEKWDEHKWKPTIWYKRERDGYHRMERGVFGTTTKCVGRSAVVG